MLPPPTTKKKNPHPRILLTPSPAPLIKKFASHFRLGADQNLLINYLG